MNTYEVGELGGQCIKQRDLAAACLVERDHFHTVSEASPGMRFHHTDILDNRIVADTIAGNMAAYVRDPHTVANKAILQPCVVNTTRFRQRIDPLNVAFQRPQKHLAYEFHIVEPLGE